MEKEHNIKLPEPIHVKKIPEKLDFFSKDNIIRKWAGYDTIDTLFYLYLFNKYKNHCLLKYAGATSNKSIGVELQVKYRMNAIDKQAAQLHLQEVAKQLTECIKRNPESIVIPLYLKTSKGGHVNLFIYRKNGRKIEHFEPHGASFSAGDKKIVALINDKIDEFIKILNKNLKQNGQAPVEIVRANDVCPFIQGLQNLESSAANKKLRLEGGGYCAAWSMFFTELALKNPNVPSNELINIIFNKLSTTPSPADYLRKVIIGYINLIYEKIEKYFYFITGTKVTVDNLTNAFVKQLPERINFFFSYNAIVAIEFELLNNPSLTKEEFLIKLEKNKRDLEQKTTLTELEAHELRQTEDMIALLGRMDILFNPSPISDDKKSPKNVTRKKSPVKKVASPVKKVASPAKKVATPLTPIDLESLSSVSSFEITPNCPEGKIFDPKKGRCVKIKTQKISPKQISPKKISPKPKTKKLKPCPEGEERNPETGRCKKIKIYPPCPDGQYRDPITHRCKKQK